MKPKPPKTEITPEKKAHYNALGNWLLQHSEIKFKRLYPFGFSIDTSTIPDVLADEFIEIATFK